MELEVLPMVPVHPTEELLEEYSFGRIHEPALATLEEHLLICPFCQSRLEQIEDYAALMKSAAAELERERMAFTRPPLWLTVPHIPAIKMILAAALLVFSVSATLAWHHQPPAEAAEVMLAALRGGEADGMAHAPSGRPLKLAMNGSHLPPSPAYRLEVVNAAGANIWNGPAQPMDGMLSSLVEKSPGPGVYWVRLYNSDGRLLREFGLRLE
jgi:hypothetical protein